MKLFLFVVFCLFNSSFLYGNNAHDQQIKELDQALARKTFFMSLKNQRIDSLKALRKDTLSLQKLFDLNRLIYQEYKVYQYDSAYSYLSENLTLALQLGRSDLVDRSKLDLAFIYTSSGLYKECIDVLQTINRDDLSAQDVRDYYEYFSRVYLDLSRFVGTDIFTEDYWQLGSTYLDSLLDISEGHHPAELFFKGQRKMFDEDLDSARDFYHTFLDSQENYSQYFSMTAATLSYVYGVLGDRDMQRKYLAHSVISDTECAITENESLHSLALMLFDEGRIRKAYEYIQISLADANFYNARLRRVEIAKSQPVIESAFLAELARQRFRLYISLAFISVLFLVLVVVAYYLHHQMKELRKSRLVIEDTNQQLEVLNLDLLESNKIKEEYIGHFLNLCSQYIDKMEHFNQMVNRKIKVGQVDALFAMTESSKLVDMELAELLENFDRIFLKLYPDFVSSFNDLFDKEDRIVLKREELLNTELRIFALVRLGVNDSSKIARFLRYAPNTVYTYRTKVKNKARVNRDTFENEVMKIGSFKS